MASSYVSTVIKTSAVSFWCSSRDPYWEAHRIGSIYLSLFLAATAGCKLGLGGRVVFCPLL